MKSFFLSIISISFMQIQVASAQMSTRPSPQDMKPKTSFDKFSDRLKIGYFGVLTTPQFDDIEKGNWRNAALSPEFSGGSNQDTWPTNMWNQLSFNFNYGSKLNFVVNPRFAVPLIGEKDMAGEDVSLILLDDLLFGFQGVVLTSEDKSFNLWIRPGLRIPTSRGSRSSSNGGAGTITNQLELAYNATYDFNKTWQLGVFGQLRSWIIEDKFGLDRFRFYTGPFVQYTLDDVSRLLVYYENILETDRRAKANNDREPVFKDLMQDVFVGYSRDLTPTLNAMPFVSCFINDQPVTDKSFFLGAWISYQIK